MNYYDIDTSSQDKFEDIRGEIITLYGRKYKIIDDHWQNEYDKMALYSMSGFGYAYEYKSIIAYYLKTSPDSTNQKVLEYLIKDNIERNNK